MSTCITPRPYQVEAERAAYSGWSGGLLRVLISLPTGMGKTVILTSITAREVTAGRRVVVFVNLNELVDQTVDTMSALIPGATVGIVQGNRKQLDAQITVVSVQTLGRSPLLRAALGAVDLIIIDECHHGSAASYVESVRDLGGFRDVRVLGVTATAVRNDALGMGDMWQRVVYSKTIGYAFDHGYLVEPDILPLYRKTGGDVDPARLADAWNRYAGKRLGMVKARTVKQAEELRAAFVAAGIPSAVVEGAMPKRKRKQIYADTRAGRNRVLISVACLTEGFDMPPLEVVMVACTIGSQTVWAQLVGRVLRLHKGKTSALVIDACGSSAQFITRADPYGLTVRPDLSASAPGARAKLGQPVAAPVGADADTGTRYKVVHTHTWYGRPITRLYLVEGRHRTRLKTLHIGTAAAREDRARVLARQHMAVLSGIPEAFGPGWRAKAPR